MSDHPNGRLRILVALLYYLPHSTGLTIFVRRAAEELVRRGHEVTVLSARFRSDLPNDEVINGVRVRRLWPFPFTISRGMMMPGYPWMAARLIKEHDLLWVHTPLLETALLGWLAERAGRPLVATHHGDLILPAGFFNRFIRGTMFFLYRKMAQRAARLIALSEDYAAQSYYLQPFAEKVQVINSPVDLPVPQEECVRALRAEWAPDGGPVIGYCGRFVEEKRPDLLLRALEVINERYPNIPVVFAGETQINYENLWERTRGLRERYQGQVRYLGQLKGEQTMANFYAACDVLAIPSDSDCQPLVEIEAMLCGTPVASTDIPGARVPVQLTGMGRLARPGNWRSIGENILAILAEPERYQKPRETVEKHYSVTQSITQYERLFRELLR